MKSHQEETKIVNLGGAVEVLEKVIGPPLYDVLHVTQLTRSLVLAAVLDHAPAQHGQGEGHGEVEFYGVAGVVVTAHQILNDGRHAVILAVMQTGVASPGNIVVARELSVFLGVEEEEGLVEGDGVKGRRYTSELSILYTLCGRCRKVIGNIFSSTRNCE